VSALRQASCALAAERFMPGSIVWCVWFPASAFCYFSAKGRLDPPSVMYSNQKKKKSPVSCMRKGFSSMCRYRGITEPNQLHKSRKKQRVVRSRSALN